jgi:thioredoxin 1
MLLIKQSISQLILCCVVLIFFCFLSASCGNHSTSDGPDAVSTIPVIKDMEHYKQVVAAAGDRLLIFELYADWCSPCKVLAPILEEIAGEFSTKVDVYKINIDKNQSLATAFRASGIPLVAFVKNNTTVLSLTGVLPKQKYVKAIDYFSQP